MQRASLWSPKKWTSTSGSNSRRSRPSIDSKYWMAMSTLGKTDRSRRRRGYIVGAPPPRRLVKRTFLIGKAIGQDLFQFPPGRRGPGAPPPRGGGGGFFS